MSAVIWVPSWRPDFLQQWIWGAVRTLWGWQLHPAWRGGQSPHSPHFLLLRAVLMTPGHGGNCQGPPGTSSGSLRASPSTYAQAQQGTYPKWMGNTDVLGTTAWTTQHLQLQLPCATTGESTSLIPHVSFIPAPQTDAFCRRVGACVQHYGTFCLTFSLRSDQLPIQKAHFRSDINRSVLVSSFFLVCSLNVFPWIASSSPHHDVSCWAVEQNQREEIPSGISSKSRTF